MDPHVPPVQVLVQNGITDVPPSFVQPLQYRPTSQSSPPALEVPIINVRPLLAGPSHPAYATTLAELARACEQWGFFQVVNHEIDETLLKDLKNVVREFFELPWEVKRKWSMKPDVYAGYAGRFSTADTKVSDWVDVLSVYLFPEELRNALMEQVPTEPATFRGVTSRYGDALKELTLRLCSAISETLGLPRDYIENHCGEYTSVLRVNYYPTCPEPDKVLGVSSHTDGSILSVLLEDGSHGLEVENEGRWILVKTLPNALVVNVGDMIQVISNGKYASVEHRAVVHRSADRFSIVAFYAPQISSEVVISPAQQLLGPANPPLYRGTTYLDYFNYFFERDQAFGKSRVDSLSIRPPVDDNLSSQ